MQLRSGTFPEKPALGLETTDVTDEATAAMKRLQPLSLSKPHIHVLVQIIKHIVTWAGLLWGFPLSSSPAIVVVV